MSSPYICAPGELVLGFQVVWQCFGLCFLAYSFIQIIGAAWDAVTDPEGRKSCD